MRLLDRYLLREFLFWLALFFGAFLLIWVAFDLSFKLHMFQDYHMRGKDVVQYYLFTLPDFIPVALPVSLLLALLYAITNHARYNEITAMRAAGISLARLCVPYFIVGLLAGAALFAMNEFYAPKAADAAEEILKGRVERQLTPQERHQVKNLILVNSSAEGEDRRWNAATYNTKTHEMTQPLVIWTPTIGGPRHALSASSALWTNHAWHFYGDIEEKCETNGMFVRIMKTTNALAMPEFIETPHEIQSEISVNAFRGINSKTHRADIPLTDIVNYLRLHPRLDRKTKDWLYTKLHGRFAGPFACLVVVFVAIPFAAGSGRRNVFVGVAASIFIFFAYFLLQQIGLTFGETGWLPSWFGAWFPNLFFTLTGIVMMARVR
jgi:lipopolysaccharide export system permease protein